MYHIIFPGGDHTKLSICKIYDSSSYELNDYSVASRRGFETIPTALEYMYELANKHHLEWVLPDWIGDGNDNFLD